MGDAAKTFQPTQTFWEASVEVFWDETDTNGQQAMSVGASVTLNTYPEGSSSTDSYKTGAAIVESRRHQGHAQRPGRGQHQAARHWRTEQRHRLSQSERVAAHRDILARSLLRSAGAAPGQ
jgi:hypothetical protein